METQESLRRQIDTATDLSSIVSTMKTLAAVNIEQYEEAVAAVRDYHRTVELAFRILLHQQSSIANSDQNEQVEGRTAVIVFGSDQGMCGQFNADIVSHVDRQAEQEQVGQNWLVLVVGRRAEGQLLDAGWPISQIWHVPTSVSGVTSLVQQILPAIERLRREKDVVRLKVFFNRRESASSFSPTSLQVLPLDPLHLEQWESEGWNSRSLPQTAGDRAKMMSLAVREHLFVSLFRACAESLASENASRIAAMQAAEKNIEERLEQLNSSFNRQRQSAITEELLDVVTGFEALARER